jgi:hypothetical protein
MKLIPGSRQWGSIFFAISRYGSYLVDSSLSSQPFIIPGAVSPGTSIKFYGTLGKGGGLVVQLDEVVTTVMVNSTINRNTPAFHANNLEDGDHQLYAYVGSTNDTGVIITDHFESVTPFFRE